jgi:hypothetical protein
MNRTAVAATVVALSAVVVGAAPGGAGAASAQARCPLPKFGPGSSYHPHIDPKSFDAHITNPWSPFRAGWTYIYSGVDGTDKVTDVVAVSRRTRVIDGVPTRIINDRVLTGGRVTETTRDYYSQDKCGNVWYFGEDTAELDRHGHVTSREGTWHAGVNGAEPGVYMQAHPQLQRKFRQEWEAGHAEDVYWAVSKTAARQEPYGSYTNLLRTVETNALEPGVRDNKYYAKGIGDVEEVTVKGGHEHLRLIDVLH